MELNSHAQTIGAVGLPFDATRHLRFSQAPGSRDAALVQKETLGRTEEQRVEAAQAAQVYCLRYQELFERGPS